MSIENVSPGIKVFVDEIAERNGFDKSLTNIKYGAGSQVGDGYISKTLAVDISDSKKSLDLFLKYALDIAKKSAAIDAVFVREILFYEKIYPAYIKFVESRAVPNRFVSIPKCYGLHNKSTEQIIALENLRKRGFTLFEKSKCMNDEHLKLVLTTFAKFHAVSFAFRDQQRKLNDEFFEQCPYAFEVMKSFGFDKLLIKTIGDFRRKLDPIVDADIVEKLQDLESKCEDDILNFTKKLSDFSILTKGDTWVNNMMFLYEGEREESPIDLQLIDWQLVARASPIHDICPLFYAMASQNIIDNFRYYMRIYHEELSSGIRELGSDPKKVYPYPIFEKEWIDYGRYIFCYVLCQIQLLLVPREHTPNVEKLMENDSLENFLPENVIDENEWLRRSKSIARHFISIGAL